VFLPGYAGKTGVINWLAQMACVRVSGSFSDICAFFYGAESTA